ncbi:MAG: hypothetical protein GC150_16335 [Rhizobiales bacterium]|nr:hypothetical protein [Hyphomicrobiales bacterium]
MSDRKLETASPPTGHNRIVLGILLMSLAMLVIPSIDAIAKFLTGIVSPGQVSWSRFIFQSLLLAPSALLAIWAIRRSGGPAPSITATAIGPIWAHAARGALISIATLLFLLASRSCRSPTPSRSSSSNRSC